MSLRDQRHGGLSVGDLLSETGRFSSQAGYLCAVIRWVKLIACRTTGA